MAKKLTLIEREGSRDKEFVEYLKYLGCIKGAEIGVEQGVFSEVLLRGLPNVFLYLVDPWTAYRGYREHVSQEKLDGFLEVTKNRLKFYDDKYEIVRMYSVVAGNMLQNNILDFVYIDGNHSYDNVMLDIITWLPKVKKGGVVAGHDYIRIKGREEMFGVVDAVNDYCKYHGYELTIWRGDRSSTWSFIKK